MRAAPLLLLALAAACAAPPAATPGPPVPEAPSAANAAERHREVQWFRTAAEYRAIALQTYRLAADRLRDRAGGLEPGSWAVIMDTDETLLDNSEFERRIYEIGQSFEEHLWDAWVLEEAAPAIPGAVEFTRLVKSLGGHVAVVTNRHEGLCPATERNLREVGARFDVVLCETETDEKEPRFRMVREGTTPAGLPPLRIVMWIGDNIRDFPDLDQDARTGPAERLALFGDRYIILPNPMYGSWMGNPWQ